MKKIEKTLSIFMVVLFVMVASLGGIEAKSVEAVEVVLPTVSYVGRSHVPLLVGDTDIFTVTSKFGGKVQYRAFLYNGTEWKELTKGYGEAVDAKTLYVFPETPVFKLGQQKLSIWVKRADVKGIKSNSNGDFDNYYVASLNCVSKDDANNLHLNAAAKVETDSLTVKVTGSQGQYLYRLHIYDSATDTWTKRVTEYTETPSYTFEKPGTYMLVVHANAVNSATWEKYQAEKDKSVSNQDETYGTYEAWQTVMVEAKEKAEAKVFDTTVQNAQFGEMLTANLTTDGVKEFSTAKQYQIFDGVKAISTIVDLGTATTVLLNNAEGYKANIKLFDENGKEITFAEVTLGQVDKNTVKVPVEPSTSEVKAIVEDAICGSLITVNSTIKNVTKYQILDDEKAISAVTEIGKTTTIFPNKFEGDKVKVKLIDAAGTVLAIQEVVLITVE